MHRQGPRVPKVYCLARIGPKKVLQTRSKPGSYLRALDRQKKSVGNFVNPRWEAAHAQAGPQIAQILLACSNRPQKSSADSEQACQSFARVRSEKKSVGNIVNPRWEAAHAQAGPRVPKSYWLLRIGPKRVLQTRNKPASHLRALDRQKKISVGNFVNPK